MPIYESACPSKPCPRYAIPTEHYYPHFDSKLLPCDSCGGATVKLMSDFKVVFTGRITSRYNDQGIEGAEREGHWAWGNDPVTKKPIPKFIETWDDQRSFVKEYGLVNPKEMPRNFTVDETGKIPQNTRGLPGTEL